jgi:flavorubredoxin
MTRHLTDDVHWLNICYDTEGEVPEGQHNHVASYLITGDEGNFIIDTGSHLFEGQILDQIEEITGREGIDAILASHGDYPHLGNINEVREKWSTEDQRVEVYGPGVKPEVHGLPADTIHTALDMEVDIQGRRVRFVDPPLADRTHTIWVYDYASKVLFTADGFGNFHNPPEECDATSDDIDGRIRFEDVHNYHAEKLRWFRYIQADKLRGVMDDLFEAYDVSYVAPIHGNPIAGEDIDGYLDLLERSVEKAYEEHDVPSYA